MAESKKLIDVRDTKCYYEVVGEIMLKDTNESALYFQEFFETDTTAIQRAKQIRKEVEDSQLMVRKVVMTKKMETPEGEKWKLPKRERGTDPFCNRIFDVKGTVEIADTGLLLEFNETLYYKEDAELFMKLLNNHTIKELVYRTIARFHVLS